MGWKSHHGLDDPRYVGCYKLGRFSTKKGSDPLIHQRHACLLLQNLYNCILFPAFDGRKKQLRLFDMSLFQNRGCHTEVLEVGVRAILLPPLTKTIYSLTDAAPQDRRKNAQRKG